MLFVVIILLPTINGYDYKLRYGVAQLYSETKVLRSKISEEINSESKISFINLKEYSNNKNITYIDISDEGKITIYSKSLSTFVVFTP